MWLFWLVQSKITVAFLVEFTNHNVTEVSSLTEWGFWLQVDTCYIRARVVPAAHKLITYKVVQLTDTMLEHEMFFIADPTSDRSYESQGINKHEFIILFIWSLFYAICIAHTFLRPVRKYIFSRHMSRMKKLWLYRLSKDLI